MAVNQLYTLFKSISDHKKCIDFLEFQVSKMTRDKDADKYLLTYDALRKKEGISDDDLSILVFQNEKDKENVKKRFSHVKTKMVQLLEQYLVYSEFLKDTVQQEIYLLRALRKDGLEQGFEQGFEKITKNIGKQTLYFDNIHYTEYKINEEYSRYYSGRFREFSEEFNVSKNELNYAFLSQNMRMLCVSLNSNRRNEAAITQLDIHLVEFTKKLLENNENEIPIDIKLYYYYYTMYSDLNTENYRELCAISYTKFKLLLISVIEERSVQFNALELKELIELTFNFCVVIFNKGRDSQYVDDLFRYYEISLKGGYIFENGVLQNSNFVNILKVSIALNKLDWTRAFVTTYSEKLAKRFRKDFSAYAETQILIKEGNMTKAVALLEEGKLKWKDIYIQLEIRRILLKFYYNNNPDKLENLLESFSSYIKRIYAKEFINESHFNMNKNLIDFVKRIGKLEPNNREKMIEQLKEDVGKIDSIAEKAWLVSKINAL